ncbi:MAG: hypothetical protein K6C06_03615 [Lachnospiraceae bacterium]|nr:hypothetical protein [Lachnospiraceae bacterium]
MSERKVETFRLTDLGLYTDTFEELKTENPKYDLSVRDRVSAGLTDVRIYEYEYPADEVALSVKTDGSGKDTGEPAAASEEGGEPSPSGETDETQIIVTAGGLPVGAIRKAGTAKIRALQEAGKISGMSLDIHGGRYKILHQSYSESESDQEDFYEETGEIPVTALLTAALKEEKPEGASFSDDSAESFITTSYDLVETETDYRKRGFAPLLLALIAAAAYLAFMIPYWMTNRQAVTPLYPVIGPDVQNTGLYIHFGLFAAGLLLTVISMGMKNAFVPAAASLLFAGSVLLMPSYVKFAAVPSLLALIGSLRKEKRMGFIRFLMGVLTLGCIGLCVWQLFGKEVPSQITSVQQTYGEMTSGGAGFDPASDMDGDEMYADDVEYDEADGELSGDDAEVSEDDAYPEDDGMIIYDANSGTMVGSVSDEEDEG